MAQDRLKQQLDFLMEIDKLKTVFRRAYLSADTGRRENAAEHSWHVTMMALLLSEYSRTHIEVSRVVELLLVHDIVEIDAGDTGIYDKQGGVEKAAREEAAAKRIFSLLPMDQQLDMMELWNEYEHGTSPEAQFARALDRLIPLLHNYKTEGKRWKEDGITSDQVLSVNRIIEESSARLWELAQLLVKNSVEKGYLKP